MASRADKYRGVCPPTPTQHERHRTLPVSFSDESKLIAIQATIQDLDPPAALSITSNTMISSALLSALSHDYTHLTVISPETRGLVGYVTIPRLQSQLASKAVADNDPVDKAMQRFARKGKVYQLITPETPLEELEEFFEGGGEASGDQPRDFAVVTDGDRKFVLGVATRADLEEFVRRRPR